MADICIKLHYLTHRNDLGFEDVIVIEEIEDEAKKKALLENESTVCLKAFFKQLGWSNYNNDKEKFLSYNGHTNMFEVDTIELLNYEFTKLFAYVEDGNNRIEMNPELVEDLHPKIANYLMHQFSQNMSISNEDLYKLSNAVAMFYDQSKNKKDLRHVPSEVIEIELAEKFGWTLNDIRNINVQDMERLLATLNQKGYQEQNMQGKMNMESDDIVDQKTGMRIIGGKYASAEMKDAIAHRIKK